MISCSMIVDDLDFVSVAVTPHEADAESIVDSNAVLSVPVTFERLQAVAWEDGQVRESMGRVQLRQLSLSNPRHCPESPRYVSG